MSTKFELKRIVQKAPKKKGWNLKEHSFSKLWMKMPDNSTVIRYSFDWKGAFSSVRDQRIGIERLKKNILLPENKHHEVAIIYDKETNAMLLIYRAGQLQMSAI